MKNYIVAYQFADTGTDQNFGRELKNEHPELREESKHGVHFMAVSAREEPEVEGKLKAMLNGKYLGDSDFVALIYSDEHETDQRKRVMVLGQDKNLENKVGEEGNFSAAEYDSLVTDMLSRDLH